MELILSVFAVVAVLWILSKATPASAEGTSDITQGGGGGGGSDSPNASLPSPVIDPSNFSDAQDNILQAIFQHEGGRAGDRNVINNNPGDLRSASGMTGTAGGFATFGDSGDGWAALTHWLTSHVQSHPGWDFYDLFSYYLRGNTTGPFQDPQGDSDAYAEYVANYAGFDPTQTVYSALYGQQGAS